jgi:diguanylate cyclase (GGDEF)-like protein
LNHIPIGFGQGSKPKLAAASLQEIVRAANSAARLRYSPTELRPFYDADRLAQRRSQIRIALVVTAITFDLFGLAIFKSVPPIAELSLILRAGMTFLVSIFFIFDRHSSLTRAYRPALLLLAGMAILSNGILIYIEPAAASLNNMYNIFAIPLILISIGLIARLSPLEMSCNLGISVVVLLGFVVIARGIPHCELVSLILVDVVITGCTVFLNFSFEKRLRRTGILPTSNQINRQELGTRSQTALPESHTDSITGVANRRCFDVSLSECWRISQDRSRIIGLIMMDIDHMKSFDDQYGKNGGNDCLRMVALAAGREARNIDLFARYGGGEFGVILPGADLDVALEIAERMRLSIESISLGRVRDAVNAVVTASFGVASMFPTPGNLPTVLFEEAIARLCAAKQRGGNRVVWTDLVSDRPN